MHTSLAEEAHYNVEYTYMQFEPEAQITEAPAPVLWLSRHKKIRASLFVILGAAVIFAVLMVFVIPRAFPEPAEVDVTIPGPTMTLPGGAIYLSLAPKNEDGTLGRFGIYAYSPLDGTLTPYRTDETEEYLGMSVSPRATRTALIVRDAEGERVLVGDAEFENLKAIELPPNLTAPRVTGWSSDDSQIVLRVGEASSARTTYLYNLEDAELTELGEGTGAVPLSEQALVTVRDEGIRWYDAVSGLDQLLLPLEGNVPKDSMSFRVSSDMKRLAWSVPSLSQVLVYDISMTDRALFSTHEHDGYVTDVTFSPDAQYLAMVEDVAVRNEDDTATTTVQAANVYSLETGYVTAIDINGYESAGPFSLTWF